MILLLFGTVNIEAVFFLYSNQGYMTVIISVNIAIREKDNICRSRSQCENREFFNKIVN